MPAKVTRVQPRPQWRTVQEEKRQGQAALDTGGRWTPETARRWAEGPGYQQDARGPARSARGGPAVGQTDAGTPELDQVTSKGDSPHPPSAFWGNGSQQQIRKSRESR